MARVEVAGRSEGQKEQVVVVGKAVVESAGAWPLPFLFGRRLNLRPLPAENNHLYLFIG